MTASQIMRKQLRRCCTALFKPTGRQRLRRELKTLVARARPSYYRHGHVIYRFQNGRRFVLHRGNKLSEMIYLGGGYEPMESLLASRIVQPGDTALDIGANIGYYAAMLDSLVGPEGEVHAFEPGPTTFAKLRETKHLLGLNRTFLHQAAVSDHPGELDLWVSTSGADAQQSSVKVAALGPQTVVTTVKSTTVEAFAEELGRSRSAKIAFVKCDIEGAEPSMLQGAKNLLSSDNPPFWLIEHNRDALREHNLSSDSLLQYFTNYEIYFLPLTWPPSACVHTPATKWRGDVRELPDECNLIILPQAGTFALRGKELKRANGVLLGS